MSKKESFLLYKSFYEPISILTNEQLGRLFRAIFDYQINNVEPTDADIVMPFQFFKNQFRLDSVKYEIRVNANKSNGLKGGRPKSEITKQKPKNPVGYIEPKKADNENDNVNDKEKDNDIPEYSEFLEYAKTLEPYKPELNFSIESKYQSWVENKWKDGNGEKIKNWKTKLRNTIPYLKPVYNNQDQNKGTAYTREFKA